MILEQFFLCIYIVLVLPVLGEDKCSENQTNGSRFLLIRKSGNIFISCIHSLKHLSSIKIGSHDTTEHLPIKVTLVVHNFDMYSVARKKIYNFNCSFRIFMSGTLIVQL